MQTDLPALNVTVRFTADGSYAVVDAAGNTIVSTPEPAPVRPLRRRLAAIVAALAGALILTAAASAATPPTPASLASLVAGEHVQLTCAGQGTFETTVPSPRMRLPVSACRTIRSGATAPPLRLGAALELLIVGGEFFQRLYGRAASCMAEQDAPRVLEQLGVPPSRWLRVTAAFRAAETDPCGVPTGTTAPPAVPFIVRAIVGHAFPAQCGSTEGPSVPAETLFAGGPYLIVVRPDFCDWLTIPVSASPASLAEALLAIVHEAEHVALDSTDEARVECAAVKRFPDVVARLARRGYLPEALVDALDAAMRAADALSPPSYHGGCGP